MTAKLGLDQSAYQTGLATASRAADKFAAHMGSSLRGLGGTLAGAFAFDRLIAGFNTAIDKGDQLQDIAEKFGLSASKLQMLGNAASVYGSSVENVSSGLNKLSLAQQKAIAGDEGLRDTFQEVGVSIQDLMSMSPEDIFLRIADSFKSGANDGRQFLIVNELLGKAQTDLIKVMNQGSTAIMEQGNAMGVWSDSTIARLSAASDNIKTLQNAFTIGFGEIIGATIDLVEYYRKNPMALVTKSFDEVEKAMAFQDQLAKPLGRPGSAAAAGADEETPTERKQREDDQEKADVAAAKFELKMIEAAAEAKAKATELARKFEEKTAQDAADLKKKNEEEAADQEARYQEELFRAEMDAIEFEYSERRRQREAREKLETSAAEARRGAAGGLLGASRAGQSAMQVAEKQRAREVNRENFRTQQAAFTSAAEQESSRTGLNLTAQDMRKRAAAGEAARANPSMADRNNAAQMGMDPGEFAAQRASFKAGLGNAAAGMSSKEIDSQFRNKLQKDAEQQKQGKASGGGQGDIYKLLEETLRKLTSAPVINI